MSALGFVDIFDVRIWMLAMDTSSLFRCGKSATQKPTWKSLMGEGWM